MATLNNLELAKARRKLFILFLGDCPEERAVYNAALQAVEDLWSAASTQNAFGGAIETAAPGAFTNAEKKIIGDVWMLIRALERLN